MPEYSFVRHTKEHRLYLSMGDIAGMLPQVPHGKITVTHVDHAPDLPEQAIRICVRENMKEEA
jgi:hypothetical protein